MKKKSIAVSSLLPPGAFAAMAQATAPAAAADAPSPLSANIMLASEDKFRGLDQGHAVVGASKKSCYGAINETRAIFTLSKTI